MSKLTEDPYLWLEDRNGFEATTWAQEQSANSRKLFESDPRFAKTFESLVEIYGTSEKIPAVQFQDGLLYNLWKDEKHPRGLWRRTSLENFKKDSPEWELLIDIDALAEAEQEPWSFAGFEKLPKEERALVSLSRNGQDACEVREFSLSTKKFVPDGFSFPESKGSLAWLDQDHVFVSPTLTTDQKTECGYPRKCYVWKRGEKFTHAKLILEIDVKEMAVRGRNYMHLDQKFLLVDRRIDFDNGEVYLMREDKSLHLVPIPRDTWIGAFYKDVFIFETKSMWRGFVAGTVLAAPLSTLWMNEIPLNQISVVFTPSARKAFEWCLATKNHLFIKIQENVSGKIYQVEQETKTEWILKPVDANSQASMSFVSADRDGDSLLFFEEDFLQARTLVLFENGHASRMKQLKSFFLEERFVSEQYWVRSKDGTDIPYKVIRDKDLKLNGKNPTLLYGYGGFKISLLPTYNAVVGKAWLEQGGVYVVANIRGGFEFGPDWHKSVQLENRQKCYDDFIAVAEDLVRKKITSPECLGINGRSNGGLLVGAVAMQRPELFNAVLCEVPLLDMIRYVDMPPGSSWMSEYGDPTDPKMHEVLMKYSPYQNISKNKKYPKMLIKTSQADDRVHPGHARKMAARMKEFGHPTLYLEIVDGGHSGAGAKVEDQARIATYDYMYLYQQLMPKS